MAITNLPHTYSITNGGTVTSGSTISYMNGTAAWTQPNSHFTSSNGTAVMTMPYGEDKVVLEEKATLEVKGNVVINGIDLEERLKTIERVLTIPERDVTLEAKHPRLKKLYEEYITALEEYKTWERLKGTDND